jgi:hypothetical protein
MKRSEMTNPDDIGIREAALSGAHDNRHDCHHSWYVSECGISKQEEGRKEKKE